MLTKADFEQVIADSIAGYPAVAPLYAAVDPRITQHLGAIATMLAMLSAQIEAALSEPFERVRDSTVLADAAMRGVIPKGVPARVEIVARNRGASVYAMEVGRTLIDSSGRTYLVETAATVPADGSATVTARQVRTVTLEHTVTGSVPFYAIEIPADDEGAYLCEIAVNDATGDYAYRERYVNVAADERVYHVEADDRRRVYVRFGYAGVVGVQPANGTALTLTLSYTWGDVNPAYGSPFAFEYLAAPAEASVSLTMGSLASAGSAPHALVTLRDMMRYPSVYDHSAVYRGEFEFLIRRTFPSLRFLSIWNEYEEERVRGASFSNINAIFVAVLSDGATEQVLTETDPAAPVAPALIADADLTATQNAILAKIAEADDAYRVRFYTPVRSFISMQVAANVATSYVATAVRDQIVTAILDEYGETSAAARRGRNRPLYQRIYALLRERVPALSAGGESDIQVAISETEPLLSRPELWRYVSPDSLSVTVTQSNIQAAAWS